MAALRPKKIGELATLVIRAQVKKGLHHSLVEQHLCRESKGKVVSVEDTSRRYSLVKEPRQGLHDTICATPIRLLVLFSKISCLPLARLRRSPQPVAMNGANKR